MNASQPFGLEVFVVGFFFFIPVVVGKWPSSCLSVFIFLEPKPC